MSATNTAVPSRFKALRTQGGPSVKVDTIARDPKPLGADHVLVKTLAVGLNPTDWKHAVGPWSPSDTTKKYVTGCDFAGLVVEAGEDVTHIKVGDRVAGFAHGCYNEHNGAYAEYVQCHKALAFVIPDGMSSVEGAAMPIPHLTAYQTLYLRLKLPFPTSSSSAFSEPSKNKKTLLVWGGSTAVGWHLIQLAKLSGCNVIVTASPDNHALLKSLGAQECFDYKDKDVLAKIKEAASRLAGEKGVWAAVDTVVERGSVEACIDAISPAGGRVITLLPVTDEQSARRSDVKVELTLGYTLQGYALTFANTVDLPAMPEDNAGSLKWVSEEMPLLLKGWSSESGGSPKYKGQKLRILPGGLESVHEGLEIMKEGNYRAEKLVYSFESA